MRSSPACCSPHKTLYNRFVRWSKAGIFVRLPVNADHRGAVEHLMVETERRGVFLSRVSQSLPRT